jgi:hypothetical protein
MEKCGAGGAVQGAKERSFSCSRREITECQSGNDEKAVSANSRNNTQEPSMNSMFKSGRDQAEFL